MTTPNYRYELRGNGYIILDGDKIIFDQTEIIPFPANTIEESAQLHINEIIREQSVPNPLTEIEQLKAENADLWFQTMALESKIDEESAALWFEIMKGGM